MAINNRLATIILYILIAIYMIFGVARHGMALHRFHLIKAKHQIYRVTTINYSNITIINPLGANGTYEKIFNDHKTSQISESDQSLPPSGIPSWAIPPGGKTDQANASQNHSDHRPHKTHKRAYGSPDLSPESTLIALAIASSIIQFFTCGLGIVAVRNMNFSLFMAFASLLLLSLVFELIRILLILKHNLIEQNFIIIEITDVFLKILLLTLVGLIIWDMKRNNIMSN